ncbi:hypothetical protein L6164_003288 [Bauhinia variegata]|uniref:Uncharacterized protein n=1 Tax=Bauhinia variegata TaxID=167791 RepID=A0ACB9Q0V1_BAUVA|nr:hypothetical protein L6164_003288 [Bauhinia variegata]
MGFRTQVITDPVGFHFISSQFVKTGSLFYILGLGELGCDLHPLAVDVIRTGLLDSEGSRREYILSSFSCYHGTWKMTGVKRRLCSDSDTRALHKELDEVSCPICMDHPHNAVLLLCSSHDKGCRSYICDTSYRHSNCLDRFKKTKANLSTSLANTHNPGNISDINLGIRSDPNQINDEMSTVLSVGLPQGSRQADVQDPSRHLDSHDEAILETVDSETLQGRGEQEHENSSELKLKLRCPMCRGTVLGWKVVEEARSYLNLKRRSCSRESCSFVGNYLELRRHARRVHPTTCPSDVDPLRERSWRHLERQREYGDIVSAIRTAMPGAVVVGDYVIENGDGIGRVPSEREGSVGDAANGSLWTTLFLFQMFGSMENGREPRPRPRPRSRAWTRHRRAAGGGGGGRGAAGSGGGGGSSDRRLLWGENLLGLGDDDVQNDLRIFSDVGEDASPVPRRRRRLTRTRSPENQS